MKEGNTVKIYGDPAKKLDYEGDAILCKQTHFDGMIETWEVRFVDDPKKKVVRDILTVKKEKI